MEFNNEDIEKIVKKTHCSKEDAIKALEKCNGNIIDAIIEVEKNQFLDNPKTKELTEKIKTAIKKGNVSKIQVKKDNELILSIPVNIGILGVVAAPWSVIVGAIAAYGFDYDFEIINDDGTIDKL